MHTHKTKQRFSHPMYQNNCFITVNTFTDTSHSHDIQVTSIIKGVISICHFYHRLRNQQRRADKCSDNSMQPLLYLFIYPGVKEFNQDRSI